MKIFLSTLNCLIGLTFLNAQNSVGIGNSSPAPSAILDLTNAQHKGLLIPSMTTGQKNSMTSPANGLLIYQIDSTLGFYFYDGAKWRLTGGGGNAWIETDSAVYTNKRVGIGTVVPANTLEAHGNIVVTAKSISTNTPPTTPGQTKNMFPGVPITYVYADSTGRFYDPGGASGNYMGTMVGSMNSLTSFCTIDNNSSGAGIELNIESANIASGDSLIVRTSSTGNVLLAIGNGYNTSKKYVFNSNSLHIRFKSNDDGIVGAGYSILFKRLFKDPGQNGVSNYSGNTFYFDAKNGSILAGMMSNIPQGDYSSAFGHLCVASGSYANAFGQISKATDVYATAMGFACEANGSQSVALGGGAKANADVAISIGGGTVADGEYSIAMGEDAIALGINSIAIGEDVEANGEHSVAIGNNAVADDDEATAMGSNTIASGLTSTAFGNTTQASGTTATSMGNSTTASGPTATAMGYGTEANGNRATSMGSYTQANGYASTAIGLFNDPLVTPQGSGDLSATTPLFIIGNGDLGGTRTNAMMVRKDGHIGIGTNTPHARLQISNGEDADLGDDTGYFVIGSVAGANIVMDNNEILARDNAAASDIYLQKTGGKVFIGAATSPNFTLNVTGTAGKTGGGTWSTYSDMRLKQNIHSYSDGLNTLLKINPVWFQYNYISGYDTKPSYVGVLAQELQEVAPYMVTPSENKLDDGSPGYLTVDNSAMIYMLINAVKELNQKIEALEKECAKK